MDNKLGIFAVGIVMAMVLSILSSPSANAGFFEDLQKQVGEWQKEVEKQVGEYQKKAEEWWEKEGKKQFEEIWRDIKKEVPKLQEKTEEDIVKMSKQAEEIWKEMPEEDREIITKAAISMTQKTIPVPYYDPENEKYGMTFVIISPLEGKIDVYEPSDREIRTFLTDTAVSTVTGGKVRVDDVEDLEIEKIGKNTYKTKIKAKGRILNVIPVEVDYEAEVNIETGEIKNVKKPWWNILIIG